MNPDSQTSAALRLLGTPNGRGLFERARPNAAGEAGAKALGGPNGCGKRFEKTVLFFLRKTLASKHGLSTIFKYVVFDLTD